MRHLLDPPPTSGQLRFTPQVDEALRRSDLEVVVTGAGGWIGRVTLEMLEATFGGRTKDRVHAFGSRARRLRLRSGMELAVVPLTDLPTTPVGPHLVAHYAFATREKVVELGFGEFVSRNRGISALVSDHVARTLPFGLFLTSSGAVYLGDDLRLNPYGFLKQQDERHFLELAPAGGPCRAVVIRVFNLAGPFLNKADRYVLGSILEDIRRGDPVRLNAAHPVIRSYVHVVDLVDLAFAAMIGVDPVPMDPFDSAGEIEVEVGQLAELAVSLLAESPVAIERPTPDGSPPDRYVGDPTTMRLLAESYGIVLRPLAQQVLDTAGGMET